MTRFVRFVEIGSSGLDAYTEGGRASAPRVWSYNRARKEPELATKLVREGFSRSLVWKDGPHARYPEHTHRTETAHIILSGEMTLTMAGETKTYRSGERCDVPAGTVHAAKMGPSGCRYLVGER